MGGSKKEDVVGEGRREGRKGRSGQEADLGEGLVATESFNNPDLNRSKAKKKERERE